MYKKLLLASLFFITNLTFAQSILNETFDAYAVGSVASDLTGATPGSSGWSVFVAQNGSASNYKFEAETGKGNVLSITSPKDETTAKNDNSGYVYKDFPANAWNGRTSGNDILRVEYEFYTGATTTSKSSHSNFTYTFYSNQLVPLGGYQYIPETRELIGAALIVNGTNLSLTGVKLGANNTALILPANTWVKVFYQIDYKNNKVHYQIPSESIAKDNVAYLTNMPPVEIDFTTTGLTGNTSTSTIKYDDYSVSAVNSTTLGVNDVISTKFNVYPNPASDIITITNNESIGIEKVSIIDINGRVVKIQSFANESEIQVNISDLKAGVYIFNVSTKEGTATKKIIKK